MHTQKANTDTASSSDQKAFSVEELLYREEIVLPYGHIQHHVFSRRILITGASGSIGSQLSRQIAQYEPSELILIDKCEGTLSSLEAELRKLFTSLKLTILMADISDEVRIAHIFHATKPHVVYHTAALKHVPFVEKQLYDAIKTNVLGTKILADTSSKLKVEKFVFVSTDKAVNPSSFMGASKRFGEIVMADQNKRLQSSTQFITARFGNVLGSSGSVVNIFDTQIREGGPITITHRDMTRYFMTPYEAGQLLLEAGATGTDGQILIFKMGDPVNISDLAIKMIRLQGLRPGSDIEIIYTGIRPGEKLNEQLLNDTDQLLPSHHHQIFVARLKDDFIIDVADYIEKMKQAMHSSNTAMMRSLLKLAVPEYGI